jgi:hypothetical protein
MATAHLKECVRLLVNALHDPDLDRKDLAEGHAAAFELIDQPWEFSGAKDVLIWREGYEQCMKDIVDAIADEWGVVLPPDPLRGQEVMAKWMGATLEEKNHGGEGQ